jgi:thiol-disulfide isomerase/thioredoxin
VLSLESFKLGVLGLGLLLAGCDRQGEAPAQPQAGGTQTAERAGGKGVEAGTMDRSKAGTAIPDKIVTHPDGRTLALPSLKGKPLLINLWATWCAPCVAELPTLDRLAAEKGDALRVLTISQDMQTEKVADFLARKGGPRLEPWLDEKSDLAFAYGAQTLPTTIYYSADGREVWRMVGGFDWAGAEAARLLAEAK